MKNKKLTILAFIVIIGIVISAIICFTGIKSAEEGQTRCGFDIEKYSVKIDVDDNNKLKINEKITAAFDTYEDYHGIFRSIPYKGSYYYDDKEYKYSGHVTNIESDYNIYDEYVSGGNKVIQLGDEDTIVSGKTITYNISYDFNLGKDKVDNLDLFYFNIIGSGWNTTIDNIDFEINMPKSFDTSNVNLLTDSMYSELTYSVNNNTITGSATHLDNNCPITIGIKLEEGYFSNPGFVIWELLISILVIILALLMMLFWFIFGKDYRVIEVVNFNAPDNLNSLEVGYKYKCYASDEAILSLIVYLASKGYLTIEEEGKRTKLNKLKDYNGNNASEKIFFAGLFDNKKTSIYIDEVSDFYQTVDKVKSEVGKGYSDLMSKDSLVAKSISVLLIILLEIWVFAGFVFAYKLISISCVIAIPFLLFLAKIMSRRTKEGARILGEIRGFKNFLLYAKKEEIEKLVDENPNYFYDILPYAYVLGVTNQWIKKFEQIKFTSSSYFVNNYGSYYLYSMAFDRSMSNTKTSYQATIPKSSSGGGSSFGGGGGFSSGGGMGGGGGGHW